MSKQTSFNPPIRISRPDVNNLFTRPPNPLLREFADAPRDPAFRTNTGASVLIDKLTMQGLTIPTADTSIEAEGTGRYSTYGHSERNGMRSILNSYMPQNTGEIERPSYYRKALYGTAGDELRAVTDRASEYKDYIERTNPNAIVNMWSDRPLCSNSNNPGGACSTFINSIFPAGSSYQYIAPDSDPANIKTSYNQMRAAYLRNPWMQQPQPSTSQVGSIPTSVLWGDLSTMVGSGYNPYSPVSSSSSSTTSHIGESPSIGNQYTSSSNPRFSSSSLLNPRFSGTTTSPYYSQNTSSNRDNQDYSSLSTTGSTPNYNTSNSSTSSSAASRAYDSSTPRVSSPSGSHSPFSSLPPQYDSRSNSDPIPIYSEDPKFSYRLSSSTGRSPSSVAGYSVLSNSSTREKRKQPGNYSPSYESKVPFVPSPMAAQPQPTLAPPPPRLPLTPQQIALIEAKKRAAQAKLAANPNRDMYKKK